jgi:hypothetical protein
MKKLILIVFAGLAFCARGQMPYNNAGTYDQAGEVHNDIFNYVKDNLPRPVSENAVVQAMDEYLKEQNSSITASEVILSPEYQETVRQFRAASDKEQFLMDDAGFTPQGAGYYTQMIKDLSTNDYEELYHSMVSLEEKISRDKSLNTGEKRLLLLACAIGRHSAYNGIVNSTGSSSDKQKIWVADAVGAIEGGASGASAAGVITIGTAVLPGWIYGALVGAARGSIIAWLSNLTE